MPWPAIIGAIGALGSAAISATSKGGGGVEAGANIPPQVMRGMEVLAQKMEELGGRGLTRGRLPVSFQGQIFNRPDPMSRFRLQGLSALGRALMGAPQVQQPTPNVPWIAQMSPFLYQTLSDEGLWESLGEMFSRQQQPPLPSTAPPYTRRGY